MFGFFEGLFANRDGKVKLYAKKIRNKDTPVEERQNIALYLADDGQQDAILALLGRFEMTYEHGMKDSQEKTEVSNLVLSLGHDAIDPLEIFIRRCSNFARPMSIYEQIAGAEKARALLLELLDVEFEKSELKPAKKKNLLIRLADFKGPDIVASASRFLDDFDEGCRYAAVEVLLNQDETDDVREGLLKLLASTEEDSGRLKHRVAEAGMGRGWALGKHAEAIAKAPPTNFAVKNGQLVPG
ncbi:MAG: hypothetical protein GY913_02850 [Proteobacteria bacterium]|nr:hypothetical protein [Pseudomonadota bacterium]MCP4915837.1 hypothetical protein [Pseudomonadota bacterium]